MYRFSTKIICTKCGKKFKAKKERKKIKYVCSGYDRYGKEFCERVVIKEEELDFMIVHKFEREMSASEIWDVIDVIEVTGGHFKIKYKDGSTQEKTSHFLKLL